MVQKSATSLEELTAENAEKEKKQRKGAKAQRRKERISAGGASLCAFASLRLCVVFLPSLFSAWCSLRVWRHHFDEGVVFAAFGDFADDRNLVELGERTLDRGFRQAEQKPA